MSRWTIVAALASTLVGSACQDDAKTSPADAAVDVRADAKKAVPDLPPPADLLGTGPAVFGQRCDPKLGTKACTKGLTCITLSGQSNKLGYCTQACTTTGSNPCPKSPAASITG